MSNDTDRPLPPVRRRIRSAAIPAANTDQPAAGGGTQLVEPPGSPPGSAKTGREPVSKSGNYEVGYAKPPRHTRFKPGQSGNPKGRPKQAKSLNTIILSRMLENVQVKTGQGITRVSRVEALFMKALEIGSRGELRAIERLLGMYAGAVPEPPLVTAPVNSAGAPMDMSAADEAILALLKAEVATELLRDASGSAGAAEGEGDDA